MIVLALLAVALVLLVIGLLHTSGVWLIASLVVSVLAGIALYRIRDRFRTPVKERVSVSAGDGSVITAADGPEPATLGERFTELAETLGVAGRKLRRAAVNLVRRVRGREPLPPEVDEDLEDAEFWTKLHDEPGTLAGETTGESPAESRPAASAASKSSANAAELIPADPFVSAAPEAAQPDPATSEEAAPFDPAAEEVVAPSSASEVVAAAVVAPKTVAPVTAKPEAASAPVVPSPPTKHAAPESDDVWVVDGRPRYHVETCELIVGQDAEPIPLAQATEDGFRPCSLCSRVSSRR